jgi:hypothetical protein
MKAKSQPDVLQAWLATQDVPPLDRQYMKYAAANDNEVFKMVMGNHDWMVVTPSEAKSGWGKILNMRMVKTWSFAELCDSRIEPTKQTTARTTVSTKADLARWRPNSDHARCHGFGDVGMGHHGHGRIVCVDARVLLLVVCADHQCQILAGAWANNRTETMANSVDISHPITVFPWRVVLGDGLCVCPLAVHAFAPPA